MSSFIFSSHPQIEEFIKAHVAFIIKYADNMPDTAKTRESPISCEIYSGVKSTDPYYSEHQTLVNIAKTITDNKDIQPGKLNFIYDHFFYRVARAITAETPESIVAERFYIQHIVNNIELTINRLCRIYHGPTGVFYPLIYHYIALAREYHRDPGGGRLQCSATISGLSNCAKKLIIDGPFRIVKSNDEFYTGGARRHPKRRSSRRRRI